MLAHTIYDHKMAAYTQHRSKAAGPQWSPLSLLLMIRNLKQFHYHWQLLRRSVISVLGYPSWLYSKFGCLVYQVFGVFVFILNMKIFYLGAGAIVQWVTHLLCYQTTRVQSQTPYLFLSLPGMILSTDPEVSWDIVKGVTLKKKF